MDDKKLTYQVKRYKNLYEKSSKEYGSRKKRAKAWANISFEMKSDVASCMSRWKNIRDRYVRLFQKKRLSGTERKWNLLEHLKFLDKHIQPRSISASAIPTSEEKEPPSEESSDPLDPQKLLENARTKEDQFRLTSKKRKRGGEESGNMKQHDEIKEEFVKYPKSRQVPEEMVEEDYEDLDDQKLISEVKKFKNLYERGNKDYRNKIQRSKSWNEISIALNIDESACRNRWKNIRDHYVKMCQRIQASGKQNSGNENNWHLFEFLGFLNNYIKHRLTTKRAMPISTSAEEEEEEEELFEEELYSDLDDSQELKNVHTEVDEVSPTGRKRKSKRMSKETSNTKQLDETQEHRKYEWSQVPGLSPSKHIPFLQMMVQKLEEMPEDHQDEIKLNVITYVYDYYKEYKNSKNTNDSSL